MTFEQFDSMRELHWLGAVQRHTGSSLGFGQAEASEVSVLGCGTGIDQLALRACFDDIAERGEGRLREGQDRAFRHRPLDSPGIVVGLDILRVYPVRTSRRA